MPSILDEIALLTSAPSAQLEVSPRRRIRQISPVIPIPTNSSVTLINRIGLLDTLVRNDALYFETLSGLFSTSTAGVAAQITDLAVLLCNQSQGAGSVVPGLIEVGMMDVTTLTPRTADTFLTIPNTPLITAVDIDTVALQGTLPSIFTPGQQPLVLCFMATIFNSNAATINWAITTTVLYRVVHGVQD